MKRIIFSILLSSFFVTAFAQTDEINISAAFSQSIALRITYGADINFTFKTLGDYNRGAVAASAFEVASSTNYMVTFSTTPLTNANGDEIDIKNLSYRVRMPSSKEVENGDRWIFGAPNTSEGEWNSGPHFHSGVYIATTTPYTILQPGPSGNAGTYEDNQFQLLISLGFYTNQKIPEINMPSLLDQNIAPGVYTCTVTLEAIPVIL